MPSQTHTEAHAEANGAGRVRGDAVTEFGVGLTALFMGSTAPVRDVVLDTTGQVPVSIEPARAAVGYERLARLLIRRRVERSAVAGGPPFQRCGSLRVTGVWLWRVQGGPRARERCEEGKDGQEACRRPVQRILDTSRLRPRVPQA